MRLNIGQKVAYPSQGVCLVEAMKCCTVGERSISGYSLRVLNDNSTIFIPAENAGSVGIRPVISSKQCKCLIEKLSEDFDYVSCDWKTRSKEYTEKLQSGDVFQVADVLKKLTFLSHEKKLSFREQTSWWQSRRGQSKQRYGDDRPQATTRSTEPDQPRSHKQYRRARARSRQVWRCR